MKATLSLTFAITLLAFGHGTAPAQPGDVLLIGDGADDTVKQFDATTGAYLGPLVAPGGGGLLGPRGMIGRNPGQLYVVNQNVNLGINGEVLRYNANTGRSLTAVVPSTDPWAPFAPRGMVMARNVLFVADAFGPDGEEGRVAMFDANNGMFLGELFPQDFPAPFHPRGVVFGPDGLLYVSVFDLTNLLAGFVLAFDPITGAYDIVASNDGDGIVEPGETSTLHRPEGLVFGPDGRLYVTSFRANAADIDRILIFDMATRALVDAIALDEVGQPRAFAQALLFGPEGKLYVPITAGGPDAGSVRRYDVTTKTFSLFVPPAAPAGPLGQPWYLTFGRTDPATLTYVPRPGQRR